ncbi:TlyA family RNA methyltransferase [bacterium]|nr:TlyA family RNA methyltransferase [bacterium]
MRKERADKLLVERGLVEDWHKARAVIMAGLVYTNEEKVDKAGQMVDPDQSLSIKKTFPYVSRGGLKLEEALESLGIPVKGRAAADLGASTGGFTDCLLQRGARKVYAVDVDTRQIDWYLRHHPSVVLIEKNARFLEESDFPENLHLVTLDVSFISVLKILPAVKKFLGEGILLALIKPQFEADPEQVGKGGVIRDPSVHEQVLTWMVQEARRMNFYTGGVMKTSIRGQKGNQEFFILWALDKKRLSAAQVNSSIKEAVQNEKH